jgi:hypothetical protein
LAELAVDLEQTLHGPDQRNLILAAYYGFLA